MLRKLGLGISIVCSIGVCIKAAEPYKGDDIYPTQIFLDCRDGEYTSALQARPQELFKRNKNGSLALHFALGNKVNDDLKGLVDKYIHDSGNAYIFVKHDLWPYLLGADRGDLFLIQKSLAIATEKEASNSFVYNEICDPLWDLITSEKDGENQVYRALKWNNIEIFKELLEAADGVARSVWAIAQNSTNAYYLAYKAFKKSLKNHCWNAQEARTSNMYMKLTREQMQQLILKYESFDQALLDDTLNTIFQENIQ